MFITSPTTESKQKLLSMLQELADVYPLGTILFVLELLQAMDTVDSTLVKNVVALLNVLLDTVPKAYIHFFTFQPGHSLYSKVVTGIAAFLVKHHPQFCKVQMDGRSAFCHIEAFLVSALIQTHFLCAQIGCDVWTLLLTKSNDALKERHMMLVADLVQDLPSSVHSL